MEYQPKNKITTQGYFVKRLRDCGYYVCKIFSNYGVNDPRHWTVLLNPNDEAIFITCIANKNELGELFFEFNDGGVRFPRNYALATDSMEVIVTFLSDKNVTTAPTVYAKRIEA
jgi:hypothetical protein